MKRPYPHYFTHRMMIKALLILCSVVIWAMALGAAYVIFSLARGG